MEEPNSIENKVKAIVADLQKIDLSKISRSSTFQELDADSLEAVEIIIAIETAFSKELGGNFPEDDAKKFNAIGDIIEYIEKRSPT